MTVVIESRGDLTLDNLRRVAVDGEGVRIGERSREAMERARASFMALLDSDRTQFIYGTTTGAGEGAKVPIAPDAQRSHAAAWGARRYRGSSFGRETLPDRVVRAIVFARLANFIEGHAKCRPVIAERIAEMLDRPLPAVPVEGQVGAGEVIPLAHVMGAMPDVEFEEAEPMAIINGSPCSAGLVADAALHARNRLELAEAVFALSVEAFKAPLEAYDPALKDLWGDPYEGEALDALGALLDGAGNDRRPFQAPVSYRILPRVLGQAHRAVANLEQAARVSLRSVTDNPVYVLPDDEHPLGRAFSTGGYHNGMASPAMDWLSASWADLCGLADRHTMKLHVGEISLLPDKLTRNGGHATGGLAFVQIGYGEAARHAAQPTFLPASEGGGYSGQNDVALPTFFAWDKHRRTSWCLDASLAMLAVTASQALWVTDRQPPPRLEDTLAAIRSYFPPITGLDESRPPPGEELGELAVAFDDAALTGALRPRQGDLRGAALF